jgi:hypothetical protein
LLLKVGQAQGEWGFHCRLTDGQGKCWSDIQVQI